VHQPLLSSESKTGLKIPSGQIAAGGFTIAAGQTKDLDIDFNTCASIVTEGNGQYRLKPVLHAGEVSTTSTSINGNVLDQATGNPVTGEVTVALEQKDTSGVDRIVMSTLAGSDGSFVFCPIPSGT
jgi:protocatechuate 3,4-dioxygenase beta subunit